MQRYLVGGAVRDALLGLPVQDRDFVVVGVAPEQMQALGFIPVGKDFPVFLHPETHEEHALARTERKTAPGYKGFTFHAASDVTLEQDLARRDLTINAMAQGEDGVIIDPFDGQNDLREKRLRHVSAAFTEDPVRILRVARFAARFVDFDVAPQTMRLMLSMVQSGEVDALVPERVWQEFSKGLMELQPSRMIEVLLTCGALERLLPTVAQLWQRPVSPGATMMLGPLTLQHLDACAIASACLPIRLALLLQATATHPTEHGLMDTAPIQSACKRLKVTSESRDLALMVGRERNILFQEKTIEPQQALSLLERCDALRKPERFYQLLATVAFSSVGDRDQIFVERWRRVLAAARGINAGVIAAKIREDYPGQPMLIHQAVRQARIDALAHDSALS